MAGSLIQRGNLVNGHAIGLLTDPVLPAEGYAGMTGAASWVLALG